MPQKVIHIAKFYKPHIGGVETHLEELNQVLIDQGYQVEVVTLGFELNLKQQETIDQVKVWRIPGTDSGTTGSKLLYKLKIWQWIWQHRRLLQSADIIQVHDIIWWLLPIYPLIRKITPQVHFFIVGSRPTEELTKLHGKDGITVTGFVDDIRPYYAAADLSVVPLRLARGVQNKVLEAMAMGKAVVTTSKALEGIEAQPGRELMVANNPETFARLVLDLLTQPKKRTQLGLLGRQFVNQHHSWDDNMSRLEELIIRKQ